MSPDMEGPAAAKRPWLIAVGGLTTGLTLLTPWSHRLTHVLALVILWWLLTVAMPGATWVQAAAFGLLSVFASVAAALTTLALLHLPCRPEILVLGILAVGSVITARIPSAPRPMFSLDDIFALTVGVVGMSIVALPMVGAGQGELAAALSTSTDGGTHVQLVAALQRAGGYITWQTRDGLYPGIQNYPAAWAGNVWIVGTMMAGGHLSSVDLLRSVGFAVAATYGCLCYFAARVALAAASLHPSRSHWRQGLGLSVLVVPLVVGYGRFPLLLDAFTQILALAAILMAVALTAHLERSPRRVLWGLGAASICVSQTWYLLAPCLVPSIAVVLQHSRALRLQAVAMLAPVATLCAFFVLTGPGANHVASAGWVLVPDLTGTLAAFAATGAAIIVLIQQADNAVRKTLVSTLGGCCRIR